MVIPTWEIRQGDVLERLSEMPDESVHCVVTSPPYWGLRDYGTAEWEGGDSSCSHMRGIRASAKSNLNGGRGQLEYEKTETEPFIGNCGKCGAVRSDNQIGLEPTPEAYVAKMVAVFREVRRVLRSDGTCWVNLGDSYAGSGCGWGGGSISEPGNQRAHVHGDGNPRRSKDQTPRTGMKAKDLVGIPWMVAFALRADGWYLRSDIVWSKPNPMPESVTDRPTKSHEYVFLLSRSAKYFFDQDAVREPLVRDYSNEPWANVVGKQGNKMNSGVMQHNGQKTWAECVNPAGRNVRSVWNIATQPFAEAHFATFPERLVDRCISAGTSEKGVCRECGRPWVRTVEKIEGVTHKREPAHAPYSHFTKVDSTGWQPTTRATDQWKRQCGHDGLPVPATVLDIFSGSGTSGVVAHRLGRNYIGIELNPQYVAMSQRRLGGTIYQASLF